MMAFKKTAQMLIIKRSGLAGSPSAYGTCYPRLPKETVNNEVPPCAMVGPSRSVSTSRHEKSCRSDR